MESGEEAEVEALKELVAFWHTEFHHQRGSRGALSAWIEEERQHYADISDENRRLLVKAMQEEKLGPTWMGFIDNYLRRAESLGLDSLQGRQALGKTIVTLLHCLETAMDEYGPMPAPGVSSGEIADWKLS